MPADLGKLELLSRTAIRASLSRLPNAVAWEKAMERALTQGHTTAYLAGLADRLNVPINSALLNASRLSRAERISITLRVQEQLTFLRGFVKVLPELSNAQIAARANLYSGAVRASYYAARFPSIGIYPGDGGTPCKGNCACTLEARDSGVWWILGAADHCAGCRARAAGSPYALT